METDHLEDLCVDGRLDNIKMDIKKVVLFVHLLIRISMNVLTCLYYRSVDFLSLYTIE